MRGVRAGAALVVAVVMTLTMSGCAAALLIPLVTGAGASSGTNSAATGTTSAPPPIQHYSDGSTSVRGNIPKTIGTPAGMLTPDGAVRTVTFVVERIVPVATCVNADTTGPVNGRYVEVDLQVITTADLGSQGTAATVSFTPDNWFFYPGGGNGGVSATGDGDTCRLATPPLPDTIGAGQTVQGSILLDASVDSAYIAYAPDVKCGCKGPGWEWPIQG